METPFEHPVGSSEAIGSSFEDEGQTRNWCNLPQEVLCSIALKLDHHTDLPRVRGVCRAWRSCIPQSSFPATLGTRCPALNPNLPHLLLFITQFYLLSPPPSVHHDGAKWLVRVGQLGHNKWHLFSPLEIDEYFFPNPPISGYVNLLDCHTVGLSNYVFTLRHDDSDPTAKPIAKKIVGGFLWEWDSTGHFVVLAMLEKDNGGGLVLLSLDNPDATQWMPIQDTNALHIVDIVLHKDKFYALDLSRWQLGFIDPVNPSSAMEFIPGPDILGDPINDMHTVAFDGCLYFLRGAYLVSGNGKLYLVVEVEYPDREKLTLIVFMLKAEGWKEKQRNNWVHVNTIGDQIFFIGYDVSFSLPLSSINLPQWKPGSICLFTRPSPDHFQGYIQGAELLHSITYVDYWRYFRIFEMGEPDKGVVSFEMLPNQLYTGLFFPPPSWVKWRAPSHDNAEFTLDRLKFRYAHKPCSSSEQTRDWSNLPKDLLHKIALKLNYRTHLPRLRGVCSTWRSSLPFSDFRYIMAIIPPPPLPSFPTVTLFITCFHILFPMPSVAHNQDGHCPPLGGRWLARMCELGRSRWHLLSPLNFDEYFYPTPPISGHINLQDCHITELACVFTLLLDSSIRIGQPITISKKIVGGFVSDSSHTIDHFVVLVKLEAEYGGGLFMFRMDQPPESQWTQIQEVSNLRIIDIAFHKNKFYALDLWGWQVGLIDHANPSAPMEFIPAPDILGDPLDGMYTVTFESRFYILRNAHLVLGDGSLYLVVEVEDPSDSEKVTIIVFVLKEEQGNNSYWEHVRSLGDQILFIGYDVSFSLPCSSVILPQWKPSSICLFGRPPAMVLDRYTEGAEFLDFVTYADYWRYFRLFEMGEEDDTQVIPFEKLSKQQYMGLFFPPPRWVKWRCPSRDNVEFTLNGLKFLDDEYKFFSD